jgi:hypothetical protein
MKTAEQNELYHALQLIRKDAEVEAQHHDEALKKMPPYGWTRVKHEAYHTKYRNEALAVSRYCFVRMMQIDPD